MLRMCINPGVLCNARRTVLVMPLGLLLTRSLLGGSSSQTALRGVRGLARKSAALIAERERQKAEQEPDWSKAEELLPVEIGVLPSQGAIEHHVIPKPEKTRPKLYPSQKSKVIRDFKLYVADGAIPDSKKEEVANGVVPQVKDFNAKVLANVLHSCKQGSFFHKELFTELAKRTNNVNYFVSDLTSVEMAMMITSLGALARAASEKINAKDKITGKMVFPGFERLVQKLVKECLWREKTEYRRTDCMGTGTIVHALGAILTYTKLADVEFQARQIINLGLKKLTKSKNLPEISALTISCTLHGCAAMEICSVEMLDMICDEIKSRLMDSTTPDASRPNSDSSEYIDSGRKEGRDVTWDTTWIHQEKKFPTRCLATVIKALGQLGHCHKPGMLVMEQHVLNRIGRFRAHELFAVFEGLVSMEGASQEVLEAILGEICKERVLRSLPHSAFSKVLLMIGSTQFRNSLLIDSIAKEAIRESRMKALEDEQLCNVIEGLADIGFQKKSVLDVLFGELMSRKRLINHSSGSLVSTIRAIHKLHYRDENILQDVSKGLLKLDKMRHLDEEEMMQTLRALGDLGYKNEDLLNGLGSEMVMRGRLHCFEEESLSDMVWHFGKLGYNDRKVLRTLSKEIGSPKRLQALNDRHMVNIVRGFGDCGFFHERVATELLKRLQFSLSSFIDPRDFAGMVRALAYVKKSMKPGFISSRLVPFLQLICSECKHPETKQLFGLQSSLVISWSLSKLNYYDRELVHFLANRFVHSAQNGIVFQPEHVLVFLDSLAHLNHKNDKFEDFALGWINDQMHALNPKQIVRVMLALNMLEDYDPELFDALSFRILNCDSLAGIDWSKLAQALHTAGRSGETPGHENQLYQLVLQKLQDWPVAQSGKGSLDDKVQDALMQLSVPYKDNVVIEQPWLVAATVLEEIPLVVEASSMQDHAISRGFELLGPSRFRDSLLKRSGYKVLRLHPSQVLDQDETRFTNLLQDKLSHDFGLRRG